MANVKITELPQVSSVSGTDILPTVASSATSKITVTDLANSLPQVSSSISASYVSGSSAIVSSLTSSVDANINGHTVGRGPGNYSVNTVLGNIALQSNTTGVQNTAIGYNSQNKTTTGTRNTALGVNSLSNNSIGQYNTALGVGALSNPSEGNYNIGIGYAAANSLRTGSQNIIVGATLNAAQPGIITGSYNTIIGTAISGLSSSLNNNIVIADGQGNIRAWHNATSWSFSTSVVATQGFTGSLFGTATSAISSSYPIAVTGSTLYSVSPRAGTDFNTNNNIFLGEGSGQDSTSDNSNFIGNQSGYQAINSYRSNFIGQNAGYQASNSDDSNFLGYKAGYQAINSYNSNFLGFSAGDQASGSNNSNFIGSSAGQNAEGAEASNFIGYNVGQNAASVQNSNFIGVNVGRQARSASYSTLIGFAVGDNLDTNNQGIGSNNIIIGKWITLENGRKDSINLGGIIFGTGSYSDTPLDYLPFSGSANGKIGINQPLPQFNLDVSGSGRYTNGLIITGSVQITNVLTLPPQNTLPSGVATGSIAVSGSGVDCKPYFWNGNTWTSMI